MKRFAGSPDYEIVDLLKECNPTYQVRTDKPAYGRAREQALIEVVEQGDGSDVIKRTDDGRDYLLWVRSLESVG